MAFVLTSLGSLADGNDRSTYTVALSRAPAADTLVLVSVLASDNANQPVQPSSVSGAGLVFSLITSSVTFNPVATPQQNLSVWRSMGATPDSSVISATGFSGSLTGCAMLVTEVSGVSLSGTSGSDAVGKSATSRVDTDSALTVFGPSATSTANAWFATSGCSIIGDVAGHNYTALDEASQSAINPQMALLSAWTTLSTGTTVRVAGAGSIRGRAGILVELVLDNPAAAPSVTTAVLTRPLRIPRVPSGITGIVGIYLRRVAEQLNAEGYISLFSGANPNTSGFTGQPGNLLVNIGSASTSTRVWVLEGDAPSLSTNSWRPVRVA